MKHSVLGRFPKFVTDFADKVVDAAEDVIRGADDAVSHEEKRVELWVKDSSGTFQKHDSSAVSEDGKYDLKVPKAEGLHVEENGEKVRPSEAFPKLAARFGLASIEHQVALARDTLSEEASKELADARDYIDALVREAATHEPAAEEWTKDDPHQTHGTAELRFFHGDEEVHRRKLLLSPFDEVVHDVEKFESWWNNDHKEQWEYDPKWPFPRRLAKQQSLLDPRNSAGWEIDFFSRITVRNYNGCIYKFLYPEDRPLALDFLGVKPPLLKGAAAYTNLFVANETMVQRKRARSDAFFVERLLGGMYPVFFKREGEGASERVVSEFRWDTRDFGPIYDGSDDDNGKDPLPYPGDDAVSQMTGKGYELPNVRAILREEDGNDSRGKDLVLEKIEVQFRKEDERKAVAGKSPKDVFEETLHITPDDDANRWEWAKRLYRTSYLLAGEIEAHICRGHLVTEQYLLACERSFDQNPVGELLSPFLWQVDKINNFGNPLIFGGRGILARASALTPNALADDLTDHLGTVDWRGWKSRKPQFAKERYARVAQCFESVVREEVDAFFKENHDAIVAHWPEAILFSDELIAHGVALRHYQNPEANWVDDSEFARFEDAAGKEREAGKAKAMSPVQSVEDLKHLCVHAIFYATFWHSWVNDNQQIDGGEVNYAAMGIRTREPPPTVDQGEEALFDWQERAAPTGTHVVFQLVNADLLPNTKYGYILSRTALMGTTANGNQRYEPDARIRDSLRARLFAKAEQLAEEEAYDVRGIRSRVNS